MAKMSRLHAAPHDATPALDAEIMALINERVALADGDRAERLGLNIDWLQHAGTRHVHFDLVPSVRQKAIREGAVEMSRREYLKLKRATEDGRLG